MALDIDKIKARLDSVKNKNKAGGFWKPQDGQLVIRIVPTADGDPFKDYFFHYNLGGENRSGILCPKKNFADDCPICDFKDQLWKEYNDSSDTDTLKLAKDMSPRQRFFSPVLVRGEEAEGVRVWGYGKEAYTALLNLVLNPEYGDITDPEAGTDLVITYGKPAGASFPVTNITPRRRSSALCEGGPQQSRELLESVPDFDEVFAGSRKTFAEVQVMLDEYLLGEDPEAVSSETTKYNNEGKKTEGSSVDQAFADLLG